MKNANNVLVTEKDVAAHKSQRKSGEYLKIKTPSQYQDDILSFFSDDVKGGIALPFEKTLNDFRIRTGELTIVSGYSGHGKTAWLSYCLLYLLKQTKVLIASFEMLPKATLGRLCMQSGNSDPTASYIESFVSQIEHKLYLYDADEDTTPAKFDVAGSANITNLADNSISVHRNKRKEKALMFGEDPEEWKKLPDCTVYLNKQRHGNGIETQWGFWFDSKTFRYKERP